MGRRKTKMTSMKKLRNAFATGVLVLVPVIVTLDILRWFVRTIDNSARDVIPTSLLPFDFHGLGILLALAIILIIGLLTQNVVGTWFVKTMDDAIRMTPVLGGLYGSIKKFMETLFGQKNDRFKGVVLVEFPRKGLYSVGFRTGDPDPKLFSGVDKALANVFVPCTPNPTSGFYLLVPEDDLVAVNLSVQDAFKIVISMGIVSSEDALKPS